MNVRFKSVKEFVCSMIENKGKIFADKYGREWMYENKRFTFKDIGPRERHEEGLKCLHLSGEMMQIINPSSSEESK